MWQQKRSWVRVLWFVSCLLLSLLVSACSSTPPLESEQPLLTDDDIDRAVFALANHELSLATTEATLPVGEEIDITDQIQQKPSSELSAQAVLPGVTGWLTYVRNIPGNSRPWRIYAQDQAVGTDVLIYQGTREIQSVAVDVSGSVFIFAMRETTSATSDFEVYRYARSTATLTRLVNNTVDDTNVSVSASGNTVVWESTNTTTGKRRVVIRDYSGSTFTQSFLNNTRDQVEPTVSGDGQYVVFIRVFSSTSRRVYLYKRTTLTTSLVSSGNNQDPSVSDGGKKVAWRTATALKVKNTVTGTVQSITGDYNHPHLSDNGSGLTYALSDNSTIYTLSLFNEFSSTVTVESVSPTTNLAPFCHCVFPTFMGVGFVGGGSSSLRQFLSFVDVGSDDHFYLALAAGVGTPYLEVQKRTKEGNLVWSRTASHPSDSLFNSFLINSAFNSVTNGIATLSWVVTGSGAGGNEIRSYDTDGNLLWSDVTPIVYQPDLTFAVATTSGGIDFDDSGNLIVASSYDYDSVQNEHGIIVTKYNSSGFAIWENIYIFASNSDTDTSSSYYEAHDVAVDSLGNIYVIGQHWNENWSSGQSVSTSSIFIQKISSGGGAVWYRDYFANQISDQWVNELMVGSDDNLYFVETECCDSNSYFSKVVKVDSTAGGVSWLDTHYPTAISNSVLFLYDVAQDSSGRIYVTGWDYPGLFTVAYANESDLNGEEIWRSLVDLSPNIDGGSSVSYGVTIDSSNTLWLLVANSISQGFITPMDTDGNFK
jgi:hypothetical protein